MSTREELVKELEVAKVAMDNAMDADDRAVALMGLRNAYYNTLTGNTKACGALIAYDKENT
jgi:hypothetical protein